MVRDYVMIFFEWLRTEKFKYFFESKIVFIIKFYCNEFGGGENDLIRKLTLRMVMKLFIALTLFFLSTNLFSEEKIKQITLYG